MLSALHPATRPASPLPTLAILTLAILAPPGTAQETAPFADLPVLARAPSSRTASDWLLDSEPFRARFGKGAGPARELVLDNGLLRRVFRLDPGFACVAFDDLRRGEALLRAARPEARVTLDGFEYAVGGLRGQPDHAWLDERFLADMQADPLALELVGWTSGPIEPRLQWQRVRHAAPDTTWPPPGVQVRFDFAPRPLDSAGLRAALLVRPEAGTSRSAPASAVGRRALFREELARAETLDPAWRPMVSAGDARHSAAADGVPGALRAHANTAVFLERDLPDGTACVEVSIDVGSDRSASWGPGLALVFADRTLKFNLRPGGGGYDSSARFGGFDGQRERDQLGGRLSLDLDGPWTLRMRVDPRTGDVLCDARPAGGAWRCHGVLSGGSDLGLPRSLRIGKLAANGGADDFGEPGPLVDLRLLDCAAWSTLEPAALEADSRRLADRDQLRVAVHYALYDGIPALSKWVTIDNRGTTPVTVDRLQTEILAIVEHGSSVETREGVDLAKPQHLHVETDFAFGGFNFENANRHVVHWGPDPQYATQVNYLRQQPCLLTVAPSYGPAQAIPAGGTFTSYRTFELLHDSLDRERRSLGLRRLYRTIAPWVTENPLMMHMRSADPARVRAALDQCAAVGFEMLILSFGSGFNIENDDPAQLAQWREIADYATQRGVEIGGYSLLSSRRIGGGNDIVPPPGQSATHGVCPALTSPWGQRYFEKLYAFFPATGFRLLEHDGPYPGDIDITPRPPLQQGLPDSRWVQWRITTDFYNWCRAQGIYVNAPDHYFLNGTSKTGMGYREVNWSLPRDWQVIHTRQNIYDGTWRKPPSLGWMFVPLTEYHGGGAAATIEPLDEHLDHYDRMLTSNLALGVQACYRGPRLYDTERVRELLARRVAWFKTHREILESDVIHGRRADGRDVDWMLHVDPHPEPTGRQERGMLVVFNPLDEPVRRELRVPLYHTGLRGVANVQVQNAAGRRIELSSDGHAELDVEVPAGGFTWVTFRAAD